MGSRVCGRGGRRGGCPGGNRTRGAAANLHISFIFFRYASQIKVGKKKQRWTKRRKFAHSRLIFCVLVVPHWHACHGYFLFPGPCLAAFRCCALVLSCAAGCFGPRVVHNGGGGALARGCHSESCVWIKINRRQRFRIW